MTVLFLILILLASVILSLVVLVQNPKGGGLAGNIAGFSNQFMGVKQTNDILEKGTWIFAALIAVLCITSAFFTNRSTAGNNSRLDNVGNGPLPAQSAPASKAPGSNTGTFPVTPAPATTK
jgi:preprotein translocase subunit SecG